MGQYYKIINKTKRQKIVTKEGNYCGVKLMEFSYIGNVKSLKLYELLAGSWKGCKVALAGDYAEIGENKKNRSMYTQADRYKKIIAVEPDYKDDIAYMIQNQVQDLAVYSLDKREYIDLQEYVDTWAKDSPMEYVIDPVCLFLATNDNHGGGDYRGNGEHDLVGRFCLDRVGICNISDPLLNNMLNITSLVMFQDC